MQEFVFNDIVQKEIERSAVPCGFFQYVNNHVHVICLSQAALDLFNFKTHKEGYEIFEKDLYDDTHPDDRARAHEVGMRFIREEDNEYSLLYRSKVNGVYHIIHGHGKHIYEDGVRIAAIWWSDEGVYDPTNVEEGNAFSRSLTSFLSNGSVYQKIRYDHLTGLCSMTYFFDIAQEQYDNYHENGQKAAIVFLDLNGMKHFNYKYGLAEGDKLIRAVGQLLAKHFGSESCSRFGQDHFAVSTTEDGLEERLAAVFKENEKVNDGRSLPLRAGICPDKYGDYISASAACDYAKMACDRDRKTYRSHFTYFDDSMLQEIKDKQYVIDNIDKAIEEGWIQVFYQSIVRAANGRVCDEEALARWIDPERGMLTPDRFIPILEDANLIYKVDLYVCDQILEKMKNQAYAGLFVVPMSINLSRSDFDTCDIVEEIHSRVKKANIDPEMLTIEITESIVGTDFDYIKSQVDRFRSLGFKVWMDDFGSGYSSLDVLQEIKFDLIKLDMRFLRQFKNNVASKVIITELVRMALGLGIETIVEGVETSEQVEFLKEIGATKLQGFYFCKPVPFEEIVKRNQENRQIGFENPDESEYFETLGRVNLYDLSTITNEEETFENYFTTFPMALFELSKNKLRIIRGNKTYREFFSKYFVGFNRRRTVDLENLESDYGIEFYKAVELCSLDGGRVVFDEKLMDGSIAHVLITRVAVNPVTRVTALATVVLAISEKED